MSAVNAVLNRLRSALGTGETPFASNNNFIVEWYNENVERIGRGPWCQMTVTWAFFTALATKLVDGRAYTVWAAQDFQHQFLGGTWHWGTAGLRPGDVVYFDWTGVKGNVAYIDHVGTCERVNGDGTFYTLEGNMGDKLQRMLRDDKYVVGYGRPDWARAEPKPASAVPSLPPAVATRPVSGPRADRAKTKRVQAALEVTSDGLWGGGTDAAALMMRTAARAKLGYPRNVAKAFPVITAQRIIDTTPDGVWGPKSQAALVAWVKSFQTILGVKTDGSWGPATDAAFLAARKANLNKF